MTKNHIFALDIGTRSVVGVILEISEDKLEILAADAEEHQKRSMQDGQIHDIEEVAKVVIRVKERLQQQLKFALKNVAVAAAGRALKTIRTSMEMNIQRDQEISLDTVMTLELQAVQAAQRQLLDNTESNFHNYQCVGYSVVHYLLNGSRIKSLIGQRGENIAIEVLATFLPREVVDSLFAVLDRAGLEMTSLTLEPIAASEVVIPESMRQLSLALVDVGAGTSDIALCAEGTMVAFAMVPEAGDEITEVIADAYLLDFHEAERVKRKASIGGQIKFNDVLGNEYTSSAEQLTEVLRPRVKAMTAKIAEKILTLSTKPVQAVFCIGGGSMTPGFSSELAEALNLSPQRVAVRGREVVTVVNGTHKMLQGPESITPLGIAVTAYRGNGLDFSRVIVNGQPVRLFKLNHGTVADALLAAGMDTKKLMGKWGMSISVTVNGEVKLVRGTLGSPAVITVNQEPARLDSLVGGGDKITVQQAINGEDALGTVGDVLPPAAAEHWVFINSAKVDLPEEILMNGRMVTRAVPLVDLADITFTIPATVHEVLALSGLREPATFKITINGLPGDISSPIRPGDDISLSQQDNLSAELASDSFDPSKPEIETLEIMGNINKHSVFVNDDEIVLTEETAKLLLFDIFKYIDFNPQPPYSGAELRLEINGKPATFTTPLNDGDKLIIAWSQNSY